MKRREQRTVDVYYCDICKELCGLPYYGYDAIGYGNCCASLMRKLEDAGVLEELSEKVPFFNDFFTKRGRAKEDEKTSISESAS